MKPRYNGYDGHPGQGGRSGKACVYGMLMKRKMGDIVASDISGWKKPAERSRDSGLTDRTEGGNAEAEARMFRNDMCRWYARPVHSTGPIPQ